MNTNNSKQNYPQKILERYKQGKKILTIIKSSWSEVSLRNKLFLTIIPIALFPLMVVSSVGYQIIHQTAEEQIQKDLSNRSLLIGKIVSQLIADAQKITNAIANNPYVIDAVRTGNEQTIKENLTKLPIEQLEQRFATSKLLQNNPKLNDYLKATVNNTELVEILITEKNGLNVAYNQPTSDFVQWDENWWQKGKNNRQFVDEASFDESAQSFSFPLIQDIRDPKSGEFLGVIKSILPFNSIDLIATYLEHTNLIGSQSVQIFDARTGNVAYTVSKEGVLREQKLLGGDIIASVSFALKEAVGKKDISLKELTSLLPERQKLKELSFKQFASEFGASSLTLSFIYEDRQYFLATIPHTPLITTVSVQAQEVEAKGQNLLTVFSSTALVLIISVTLIIIVLARQITTPLTDLTLKAEQVASGNLDVVANPTGTIETRTLALNFNKLVERVKQLLSQQNNSLQELEQARQQAEMLVQEQRQKNESLQLELMQLLGDVEGASTGDLTVRSQINEGEIGIVADFFNSIIESLRDIVRQVKQAATQVNSSVDHNQTAISKLAIDAIQQAEQITQTLTSVEQMTHSIQEVAKNAQTAAQVTQIASSKAETGGLSMEKTVTGILQLRQTIDETGEKVKSLGEASQQISRVISLINQIAIQTNLLAINASIEAARAGEQGKGFAVVAEEVGALAAQSATATKEVEKILAKIQTETDQVVEAMEIGTIQVVEGTRLAENTKQSLEQIVEISRQIDQLVQSISNATVSQAQTSQVVTQFMEQVALVSEKTSAASQQVSDSLTETVTITKKLQASVDTFKVEDDL